MKEAFKMKVKEVSNITGVSVRTLHHYNDIGLLVPDNLTEAGYRLYSDDNLATLQQILFFREVGFSLKKIKDILTSPTFDREEAFVLQREMLLKQREKLDAMIHTIEKTIQFEKGEISMANEEKFQGFNFDSNPYEQEAREKWGNERVDESKKKVKQFGSEIEKAMNRLYVELAEIRHLSPASDQAQEKIAEWYRLLNTIGNYSLEAFKGLGEMYVADERFTNNIDQFGEGLAAFMCDAMGVYVDKGGNN